MFLLDANVLLHAYNSSAPQHVAVARWLDHAQDRGDTLALPWVCVWAFLRITTNPRLTPRPMDLGQAFDIIYEWLAVPDVLILGPGLHHASLLRDVAMRHQIAGPRMTDAVLVALAREHDAVLVSSDRGFGNFPALKWINPLES